MSSSILRRSSLLSQNPSLRHHFLTCLFSSLFSPPQSQHLSPSNQRLEILGSGYHFPTANVTGSSSVSVGTSKFPSGSSSGLVNSFCFRLFGSQAAVVPSTSDGLTVEGIISNQWTILDESENDWKSHASAIAQSIHVIKRRLQVLHSFSCLYKCTST